MPIVFLKKVNRAVKAYYKHLKAKETAAKATERYLDAYGDLNSAERQEYTRILTSIANGEKKP